ncbi:MAG: M24 family metallopeptidase, partial [Gemmatimonadota bacterium]
HIQHRLGHGMDRALHGFGPNLDSVETRDERELVPGIGFSVEPGVYLPGRFGVRSEINVYMRADGPEVTTPRPQMESWPHRRAGSR